MRCPSGPGQGGASRPGKFAAEFDAVHQAPGVIFAHTVGILPESLRADRPGTSQPALAAQTRSLGACAIMEPVRTIMRRRARSTCGLALAFVLGVAVTSATGAVLRSQQGPVPQVQVRDPQDRAFRPVLLPGGGRGRADSHPAWPSGGTRGCRGSSTTSCAGGRSSSCTPSSSHFRQTNAVDGTDWRRHGRRHRGDQAARSCCRCPARSPRPTTCSATNWSTRSSSTSPAPIRASRWPQAPGHPRVPAVVRRRHGRVPHARRRSTRRPPCGCATRRCARTLPHIKDLDDPKYFPYRWGHAFWAYIGARYGDRTVASLLRSAANPRIRPGRAWRASSAPIRTRSPPIGTRRSAVDRRGGRRRRVAARAAMPRLVISSDSGRRALQRRPAREPGRKRDRVLLRTRPLLHRPLHGRRRVGQDSAQALVVGHRPALRQPRVPEFCRRLESRRRGRSRSPRFAGRRRSSRLLDAQSGSVRRETAAAGTGRRAESVVLAGRHSRSCSAATAAACMDLYRIVRSTTGARWNS